MREPSADTALFGLLAEFATPDALLDAVKRAHQAGFRRLDAYSPFPIDGLSEAMDFHEQHVPWLTLAGGVFGAALGYGMQVFTNRDFPIDIGGRPLIAPPAFMLITFELMVLFAVLFSILGMLLLNRLPRLHHPLFDIDNFHLASRDKYFLVIFGDDGKFDRDTTRRFLNRLDPLRIDLIEHTEEPE